MKPPAGPAPPDPGAEDRRTGVSGGGEGKSGAAVPKQPGPVVPPSRPDSPLLLFLFGIPVHNVTTEEALDWIELRARSGRGAQMVTSNLDFIMQAWRDPEMQRIHLDADLVVADGWPPVFFSRLFGPKLKGRVAGSDLVVRLGPFASDRGLSLYALGGREGVAVEAMRILRERSPALRVAGCSSPPVAALLDMDHAGASAAVAQADPDVLLVAFGAPKQDKWIRMNLHRLGGPVAMGIGASLDFIAGAQTRAPRWVQALAMEWFWRLCSQPRRLFKRYSSNLIFLTLILIRLAFVRLRPAGRPSGSPAPEESVLQSKAATLARFPRLAAAEQAEAFCAPLEAEAARRTLILDLSESPWLSSLELGALVRLSQAARIGRRRLLLSGVRKRPLRLLRLLRLDRWLEIPQSVEDWNRRLEDYAAPEAARRTRWSRSGSTLEILLPEEFEGGEAARAQSDLALQNRDGLQNIVIDGGRLRYIDSSGLLFLKTAHRGTSEGKGIAMSLRTFPLRILEVLRREGLNTLVPPEV
jgi:N-acetylglucosaminyldiphosphoundecaprenol N-acetyl-beta-D-mannosaminyltransferase